MKNRRQVSRRREMSEMRAYVKLATQADHGVRLVSDTCLTRVRHQQDGFDAADCWHEDPQVGFGRMTADEAENAGFGEPGDLAHGVNRHASPESDVDRTCCFL